MTSPLTPLERETILRECLLQLLAGHTTEGKVLSKLRKHILGMNQDEYATLVGISRRTLSAIENDMGDQTLGVLNAAFKPFGLRLGLLPTQTDLLVQVIEHLPEQPLYKKAHGFVR